MSQDNVPEPRVPLRLLLAWLRILAGRRGHSAILWRSGGFTYGIEVDRVGAGAPALLDDDVDETVPDRAELLTRIRERLVEQP